MKQIIFITLLLIAGWWLADMAYQQFYLNAEKKPFWKGTDEVQVCKVPYYSSNGCKRLKVELVDDTHARIHYFVTNTVKEQTEGLPTEEQLKQAYFNAMMAGDTKAAEMIKEANEFVNPDRNVPIQQQLDVFDLECKFTAGQPRYVVCNGQDTNGQEWDFHPTWVTIN